MLRVGDKLLCKRDKDYYNYENKCKGIIYTSNCIDNNKIYFNETYFYVITDQRYFYIWRYFYKPNELRKLKLEKLNKIKKHETLLF